MTGRAKRADWFPLTLAVLKFILALSVISFISVQVAMGAKTELTAEKDSVVSRVPLKKESIVLEAITDVENKQMERAMEKCLQIQEEDLPEEVKEYFDEFRRYYLKKSRAKNASGPIVDETFFVGSSIYVTEYLSQNTSLSPVQVLHAGEVIPYFCISHYSAIHSNLSNINQNLFNLCGQYIQLFVYPEDSPSRMSCDMICLEIKTKFYSYPKKEDYLRQVIALIDEYQNTYSDTLGPNGTFHKQRDYLESARSWCNKKINGKWFIGSFPDYFM